MSIMNKAIACGVGYFLMGVSLAHAALYEVGPGKTYATIQAAVNAAAATDLLTTTANTPPASPVDIVVFAGTYTENVDIPADGATTRRFNSQNDRWTVRANPGDRVLLIGGISVGIDRDNSTFNGINVNAVGRSGYHFAQTARSNNIRNCFIYGGNSTAVNFAGISMNRLFGTNFISHVTIHDMTFGVQSSDNSTWTLRDSIVSYSGTYGLGQFGGNANSPAYCDIFNAQNCNSGDIPPGLGVCTEAYADGGNNVNYSLGNDPMYASTNPADPDFLKLRPNSPAAGTGQTAGDYTNGQLNMGALETAGAPATLGACCYGDAQCIDSTSTGCPILPESAYQGDGTACVSTNCQPPTGACCLPSGTCAELTTADCTAQNGIHRGLFTTCAVEGQVCANTGACCTLAETCSDTNQANCLNVLTGQYRGDGTACASTNCVRTLLVGPGKPYLTIQAAVNAAVLFDDPAAQQDVPPFKPVTIIMFEGIYDEIVNIPQDSAGQVFNGANDSWTIRAARTADTGKAVDDIVILRGRFDVGIDREFFTFDGINIMAPGNGQQDYGYYFVQTSRSNMVKNCIIWNVKDNPATGGDLHGNAIYNNRLFGNNRLDHVTMVNNDNGIYTRDVATVLMSNSILAFSTRDGLRVSSGSLVQPDYSLVYNPPNLPPADPLVFEQPVNCQSAFQYGSCPPDRVGNGGNNVNWPLDASMCSSNLCSAGPRAGQACATDADCVGQDPQFVSLDPNNLGFLRLAATSPARGAGSSPGQYTNGEANIGALSTGALPPSYEGACCLPDTSCTTVNIFGCAAQGGVWNGAGVSCGSVNCSIGACCDVSGTCAETTQALCTADGEGTFQGIGTTCAATTCPPGPPNPFADWDRDGDVDADDFGGGFQRCYTGSGGTATTECEIYDRPEVGFPSGDGDVDGEDLNAFLACVSGPEVPADETCDDPPPL